MYLILNHSHTTEEDLVCNSGDGASVQKRALGEDCLPTVLCPQTVTPAAQPRRQIQATCTYEESSLVELWFHLKAW